MSTRLLIDLQGRTMHDITRVIIASADRQALIDWRLRLLDCVAEMERDSAHIRRARELRPVERVDTAQSQAVVICADAPDVTPKSVL